MTTSTFLALVCSASLIGTSVVAQDASRGEGFTVGDSAKGASLLAEARKALGGVEKLSGVRTLQVKGAFRRTIGANQLDGDLEILIAPPDRMKRVEDTSFPGGGPSITLTQALNGGDVWDENSGGNGTFFGGPGGFGGGRRGGFGGGRGGGVGGGGSGRRGDAVQGDPDPAGGGRDNFDPERMRQAQLRQRRGELSRLMLAWLMTTEAPASWVGKAESPDGQADVVEIKAVDAPVTRLFLDASSHMPLMLTWQGAEAQFFMRGRRGGRAGEPDRAPDASRDGPSRQSEMKMTLGDYTTEGGIRLPRTITRAINGQTVEEWTGLQYKVNPSVKPNSFEKKK